MGLMSSGGLASALQPQTGGLLQRLLGTQGQSGIGQRLTDLLDPRVALPAAGELIAGRTPQAGFGAGLASMGVGLGKLNDSRKLEMDRQRTKDYLAKTHPELAQMVDMGLPIDDAWKEALKINNGGDKPNPTDDMREYDIARTQGFDGSFMDYMVKMKEAGRNQVNIDTGVKLPTGFRWKNPDDQNAGVEPIPGGPGEQVPAELAARVGMADNFISQLPNIKAKVKAGEVTGPLDRAAAASGFGGGAQTYRQIQSGVDALTRMLSGAGMNQTEAAQYAQRYLPTYADDADSMLTKLDQLEAELKSTKEMTMRGRGGTASPTGDEGWSDLGNGVRIRKKQ